MGEALHAARAALESVADRCIYIDSVGCVLVDDQPIDATYNDPKIARFVGNSQKLLAALADECERLRAEVERLTSALDAMTNQAVMASGRRATIVTEDGELERLRAENARLREAMPGDDVRDEINDASVMLHEDGGMPATLAWLARLDAARKGVL